MTMKGCLGRDPLPLHQGQRQGWGMSLFKQCAARDPAYLKWVREQPSVISGALGCEAHHPKIRGHGGSTKCSDYWAIPLTHEEHMDFHARGQHTWEAEHGSQALMALRTLERWVVEMERDS